MTSLKEFAEAGMSRKRSLMAIEYSVFVLPVMSMWCVMKGCIRTQVDIPQNSDVNKIKCAQIYS